MIKYLGVGRVIGIVRRLFVLYVYISFNKNVES